MHTTSIFRQQTLARGILPGVLCVAVLIAASAQAADTWTDVSTPLLDSLKSKGLVPAWPGGCAGVVTNRLNGDVVIKVVGQGLWRSSDKGATWTRIDGSTVGGRDETGWATNVDQNDPRRMASFALDGLAGLTADGTTWRSLANNGRNWDFGSVDWATPSPMTIIAARHESGGEVDLSTDGGKGWKKLPIALDTDRSRIAMVGALDAATLIYAGGKDGILRSTDSGATWAKVSPALPQTRIPVLFNGAHYLGTAQGLLVSKDKGTTWQSQGAAVSIWQGPFFGADESKMVVVGERDIHMTTDAGRTWTRLCGLKPKQGVYRFDAQWFGCYAWDPVNNTIYASSMGNPVYKLEVHASPAATAPAR